MTLLLTRANVREMLDYDSCISAIEDAFRAEAEGRTLPASVLGTHVSEGGFHVKTAGLELERPYYAAKINSNFPRNPVQHALPTIQGVLALYDANDGRLLALMDSMEVTSIRTAAATAVAAKYLARRNSTIVTVIGCGIQGRSQLRALSRVVTVQQVFAFDATRSLADSYSSDMSNELGIGVKPVADYQETVKQSDIVVTCTTSQTPLLARADVANGVFIAAVGADSESKWEIAPDLLVSSTVVVDVLEQCATIGDLHHAIESGVMKREDVHANLAQVVSGRRTGRTSDDEVIVFDSTGTALEDVAAAAVVYQRAIQTQNGLEIDLGD